MSPPRSRGTRLPQMTCWFSRGNGEMADLDETKRVIYTKGVE